MFQNDHSSDRGRRGWVLPVALFFVSVLAMARAFTEAQGAPRGQFLIRFLGPAPMLLVLFGSAALGAVWYTRGRIAFPFRKVLALCLLALPFACFLGTLQSRGEADSTLWGGVAGRNLAHAMPDVMGKGITAILMLFSGIIAWRLAFQAPKNFEGTDPLARVLAAAKGAAFAPAFSMAGGGGAAVVDEEFAQAVSAIEAPSASTGDEIVEAPEFDAEDEEPEGSLFAPRPALVTENTLDEDTAAIRTLASLEEPAPADEIPAYLRPQRILEGLEDTEITTPAPPAAPVLALREALNDDDGEEERFRELEAAESLSLAAPIPPLSLASETGDLFGSIELPEPTVVYRPTLRTGEREHLAAAESVAEIRTGDTVDTSVSEGGDEEENEEEFGIIEDDEAEDEDVAIEDADFADDDEKEDDAAALTDLDLGEDEAADDLNLAAAGLEEGTGDDEDTLEEEIPAFLEVAVEVAAAVPATGGAPEPESPLRSLRLVRGPAATENEDFGVARTSPAAAEAPSFHLFPPVESESPGLRTVPGARPKAGPAEDWAAWGDEDDGPRRPRARAKPARGTETDGADQQILFAPETKIDDEVYRRAVDTVINEQRCSVAMLQRTLDLSFSDATAAIDRMHEEGVVGPQLPSGRREILAARAGRPKTDSAEA